MYLKRLVCKNLRGFSEIDLDLCPLAPEGASDRASDDDRSAVDRIDRLVENAPASALFEINNRDAAYPGWSVITGDNGSGKTTVLKAIALALMGPDQARYLQPSYAGWVSHGMERAEISLEIRPDNIIDKTKGGGALYKNTFWAEVDIIREPRSSDPLSGWVATPSDHYRKKRKGATNGPWDESTTGWLALGYGPFRRLYGSSSAAAGLEADPTKARFATLFMEDATLIEAEKWLRDLDYRIARAGSVVQREEAAETLEAVIHLLRADFLRNNVTFQRVDAEGVWLSDTTGREFRLADMSEGYRAAIATLIDIVRHMFLAYGPGIIKGDPTTGAPFVDAPGVVLIDEIDAHLHPAWQQEIGFWLKSHFPRVQFIVTTHSPFVCQAADGGRIYTLPTPDPITPNPPRRLTSHEYVRVISGDSDAVLQTEAFGLVTSRSSRVQRAMKRHTTLRQLSLLSTAELGPEIRQLELFLQGELPEA